MKKEFSNIKELLGSGLSGFGWDDTTKRVMATDEVWDAKIRVLMRFVLLLFAAPNLNIILG